MAAELGLYFLALGSGIISFISPCVLGLLPPFISYIASTAKSRKSSFILSVLYSVGFFLTFAVLGAIFLIGMMSLDKKREITIISGIITIILAIYLFFNRDLQKWWRRVKGAKLLPPPPETSLENEEKGVHRVKRKFQNGKNFRTKQMYSDSKERSSFLALLFATGDLRRWAYLKRVNAL